VSSIKMHSKVNKKLSAIKLIANTTTSVQINYPSLIFSEFDDFLVDDIKISKQQSVKIQQPGLVNLTSAKNQHIMIYSI
jgi:hypothetical protein